MMPPHVPVAAPVAAPVATAPVPALQAVPHEVVAAIDVFAQYEDVVRNCGPVSVYVERTLRRVKDKAEKRVEARAAAE